MTNIGRSLSSLTTASNEANTVNTMIENTSQLAENVSSKVRRLDEARVNINILPKTPEKHFLNSIFSFSETCI